MAVSIQPMIWSGQIARDVKDVPSVVTEWESPFYWIHKMSIGYVLIFVFHLKRCWRIM